VKPYDQIVQYHFFCVFCKSFKVKWSCQSVQVDNTIKSFVLLVVLKLDHSFCRTKVVTNVKPACGPHSSQYSFCHNCSLPKNPPKMRIFMYLKINFNNL